MAEKLKIAVVGCGAVSDIFHLPVIAKSNVVEAVVLVDKVTDRARKLAEKFNVSNVVDDHRAIIGKVDAAIVAVPHHIHAPVTVDLLSNGIHVLVEKPMAMSVSACNEMITAASQSNTVLAVAMQRRFGNAARFVKHAMDNGLLGMIKSFDLREGAAYGWPVEDKSMLSKEVGGGAVTGSGVHALDLLLWWLGDYESVEYYDDAMGGVEADCEFHIRLKNGAEGVVEFSRTRALRNTWIINGEHGVLEFGIDVNAPVSLRLHGQEIALTGHVSQGDEDTETVWDLIHRQLDDFIETIKGKNVPLISGEEGKRAIQLMESSMEHRHELKLPWMSWSSDVSAEVAR